MVAGDVVGPIDARAFSFTPSGPRPQGYALAPRELDRLGMEHLGPVRGQLEHLFVGDGFDEGCRIDDAWVRTVDSVHVGADLAVLRTECTRERDRGRVGSA